MIKKEELLVLRNAFQKRGGGINSAISDTMTEAFFPETANDIQARVIFERVRCAGLLISKAKMTPEMRRYAQRRYSTILPFFKK
ncbi:hypothetical protein C4559_05340 [Candidatus Microgenomates bacterium]|nr:MAG: hypothetical protein C4559_05340 [Candidatus Microgenomates bacterium]